ncbi:hypothetical protein ES332_A05G170300v1 [Gossypium tomentosum]|uniref:Uncharacterized protein n=1 Tax=Gossypium tomentosum TaxID=34277 RepID=A0A5D2QJC9_GOSTO|nr:hypothetical protein ES332_A05G170300v1 [Gossypium tomentosum]
MNPNSGAVSNTGIYPRYRTSFHTRPYIIHSSKAPIAVKNISCSAL